MATVGLNFSIAVTNVKYANLTAFVDSNPDEYGQNGGIIEQQSKEEQEAKHPKNFVGNAKIFWTKDADNFKQQPPAQNQQAATHHQAPPVEEFDDDIPF